MFDFAFADKNHKSGTFSWKEKDGCRISKSQWEQNWLHHYAAIFQVTMLQNIVNHSATRIVVYLSVWKPQIKRKVEFEILRLMTLFHIWPFLVNLFDMLFQRMTICSLKCAYLAVVLKCIFFWVRQLHVSSKICLLNWFVTFSTTNIFTFLMNNSNMSG